VTHLWKEVLGVHLPGQHAALRGLDVVPAGVDEPVFRNLAHRRGPGTAAGRTERDQRNQRRCQEYASHEPPFRAKLAPPLAGIPNGERALMVSLFVRLTVLVAIAIVALFVLLFVVKIVFIAAVIAALAVAGILAASVVRRRLRGRAAVMRYPR
jgi:hypothetical protein